MSKGKCSFHFWKCLKPDLTYIYIKKITAENVEHIFSENQSMVYLFFSCFPRLFLNSLVQCTVNTKIRMGMTWEEVLDDVIGSPSDVIESNQNKMYLKDYYFLEVQVN